MRKILCILLCGIMLLSLFACDNGNNDGDGGSSVSSSSEASSTSGGAQNPSQGQGNATGVNTVKLTDVLTKDEYNYVYVSSVNGKDSNDGLTKENPVATLERAQQIASGFIGENDNDVVIAMESGDYYMPESLNVMSGTDTQGIYFVTYGGGQARILGGKKIDAENIRKADATKDKWALDHISDDNVKNNLYAVDLKDYSAALTTLLNKCVIDEKNTQVLYDVVQFYKGNSTLEPARWPNVDEETGDARQERMQGLKGWCVTTYINYIYEGNKGGLDVPENWKTPTQMRTLGGYVTTPMNVWLLDDTYNVLKNWDFENQDVMMFDFLSNDWDDYIHRVDNFVDCTVRFNNDFGYKISDYKIYKGYLTTDRGRTYNGDLGAEPDENGNTPNRRFYLFNALEAIDLPGEYYYDYEDAMLYIYLEDEADLSDLYMAVNDDAVLKIRNCKNVHFINVDIMYGQANIIDMAGTDSNNMCSNISFIGCILGHCGRYIMYSQYAEKITIKDCEILESGSGCIFIRDAYGITPNKEIKNAQILIENCDIHDLAVRHYSYAWAVNSTNVSGLTVRNCNIYNGKHGALFEKSSSNIIYEYNNIYNFITDVDDCGVFYDLHNMPTQTGIVARYNMIHDIGNQWAGWGYVIFYIDGDSSGYAMHSNLIYNISEGGNCPTQIFGKMRAAVAYNNLIFNTGSNVKATTSSNTDGWFRWWRNLYSSGTIYDARNYQVFDNYSFGSDEYVKYYSDKPYDEAYSFNMLQRFRSSEFFYKIYGSGIAFINNGKSEYEGGMIAITQENIAGFKVVLSTNRTNQADGTNMYKGKQLKTGTEFRFETVDEMFSFLYDCCGNMSGSTCNAASVWYGSNRVTKYYANMYRVEEQYAELDDETGDIVYPPSKYGAKAGALKGDEGSIFPSKNCIGDTIGCYYFKAINTEGYLGEYYDNITINCAKDFSTPGYQHTCVKRGEYADIDNDTLTLFNEDGTDFSLEIYDYVDNLHDQGKLKGFTLTDSDLINKCGAKTVEYDT